MSRTTSLLIVLSLLASTPAVAQPPATDLWAPWIGCWVLAGEETRDGAALAMDAGGTPARLPAAAARPRICVTAAGPGAATLTTRVGDRVVHELTLTPDATDRALTDGECRGTQRAEWSPDGRHLYSGASLTCGGDAGTRRVSGIALLTNDTTWLDVQSVTIGDRASVRVRRYRRATDRQAAVGARRGTPFTASDVRTASGRVSPLALEAALVEGGLGFIVSKAQLLEFADANVPEAVVDVVVALSYPERFVVERDTPAFMGSGGYTDPYFLGWALGYPFWFDNWMYATRPYGMLFPGDPYGAFGYAYGGPYDTRVWLPSGGLGGIAGGGGRPDTRQEPSGNGRVVNGQGYTRIRPRTAGEDGDEATAGAVGRPAAAGRGTPRVSAPADDTAGTSSRPAGEPARPSGRTAQPR